MRHRSVREEGKKKEEGGIWKKGMSYRRKGVEKE